jgi:hypothetical protein
MDHVSANVGFGTRGPHFGTRVEALSSPGAPSNAVVVEEPIATQETRTHA